MGKRKLFAVIAMLLCGITAHWQVNASPAGTAYFIADRSDTRARASGAGGFTYSIRDDFAAYGETISFANGTLVSGYTVPLGGATYFNIVLYGSLEAGGGGAESRILRAWVHANTNTYIVAGNSPGRLDTNAVVLGRDIQATARDGDGHGYSELTARADSADCFNNVVRDNSVSGGGNCTGSIAAVALTDTKGVNVIMRRGVHTTTRTSHGCGDLDMSTRSAVWQLPTAALCFNSRQAPLTTVT